jgi:hypothetical protein
MVLGLFLEGERRRDTRLIELYLFQQMLKLKCLACLIQLASTCIPVNPAQQVVPELPCVNY